jgi:predicted ATP-dependent serine protease
LLAVEASALKVDEDLQARGVESIGYPMGRLRNVLLRLQADCGAYTRDRAIRVHVPRILGEEIEDEEIDLAVAAALLSAMHGQPPPKALIFGSVGIAGHVSAEFRSEMRMIAGRDHKRFKFTDAIVPTRSTVPPGVKATRIRHMNELCGALGVPVGMPRPPKADDDAG